MFRTALILVLFFLSTLSYAQVDWQDSSLVKTDVINGWCRHCPDWNKTNYFFKLADGSVYVAQTHKTLDVTLNGRTRVRFDNSGHVGDYLHLIDDSGREQRLRIIQKIAG